MANNQYVNKVVYGNNTVMDISNTTANAGDVLEGQTFYAANGAQTTGTLSLHEYARNGVLKDSVGWITLHNFFDDESYDDTTKTVNGITFTDNGDGSITVSGTATGDARFELFERMFYFDSYANSPATFFLSGCPFGGSFDSYSLFLRNITSGDDAQDFGVYDFDRPRVRINRGDYVSAFIYISSGTVISNPITFRPELKISYSYEGSTEDAYYPQQPSVKQTLRNAEVIEGKNLLEIPNNVVSQTINGVTFTVNRNAYGEVESIVANGTPSNSNHSYFDLLIKEWDSGVYLLNGCPSGGSSSTFEITCKDQTLTNIDRDYGNGATINITSKAERDILITIRYGYTANNLVFKPMLRLATEEDSTFEPYYTPLKDRLDGWVRTTATVSSGAFSFSGLDDTKGYAYKPYCDVDGNSTNLNPTSQISSIVGAGTSSMTISYTTDADEGATVHLRIVK